MTGRGRGITGFGGTPLSATEHLNERHDFTYTMILGMEKIIAEAITTNHSEMALPWRCASGRVGCVIFQ
jgi:hypothetical protein